MPDAERRVQLEAADEQRHQHGVTGEVFHPAGDMQEFHLPQADAELADEYAETGGRSDVVIGSQRRKAEARARISSRTPSTAIHSRKFMRVPMGGARVAPRGVCHWNGGRRQGSPTGPR